jgi:hypothetical protein
MRHAAQGWWTQTSILIRVPEQICDRRRTSPDRCLLDDGLGRPVVNRVTPGNRSRDEMYGVVQSRRCPFVQRPSLRTSPFVSSVGAQSIRCGAIGLAGVAEIRMW